MCQKLYQVLFLWTPVPYVHTLGPPEVMAQLENVGRVLRAPPSMFAIEQLQCAEHVMFLSKSTSPLEV